MERNRKPHEAARCSQVPTKSDDASTNFPPNFGVENGMNISSRSRIEEISKPPMVMSSRFGNNEMKCDNCKGVQHG